MTVHTERILSDAEKRDWLAARGSRRTGPHAFKRKVLHWLYCARCGLLLLKNDVSRRAAARECVWEE